MIVYKHLIPTPDETGFTRVKIPVDASIISIGMQEDEMVAWSLCYVPCELTFRTMFVINTGVDFQLPPNCKFHGTLTSSNGVVWHVWEALGSWAK